MRGDTKTEPAPSPKVEAHGLPDEVRAEVESLVQAALAKMQEANFNYSVAKAVLPVAEISTTNTETELERRYKEIVSTLEAKLSDSDKQLQSAYRDLGDVRDQLEKQRAKSVQLEQRILQMSEAEGTFKSTLAVLRAEKDKTLAREREALMARDRAGAHNAHLSTQLSELQSSLDLKVAELNDITYIRRQLENRINELNRENMSLRQAKPSQGASTGAQAQSGGAKGTGTNTQPTQPPSNLYFSMPARRHTVPNLYPPAAPTAPAASTSPTAPGPPSSLSPNRPPKRARADSDVSEGAESTHSGASSGSSMTFALRPVKPEPIQSAQPTPTPIAPSSNANHPRYIPYSPVSAPLPLYYTSQQQQLGAYAAPIPYQNQRSYQTQAPVPQKSSSASPTLATAPPAINTIAPTMVSTPAQMMQHAPVRRIPSVQQFINQMFVSISPGFPECKICKVRPLGAPNANGVSTPPTVTDLLAHADQYHGKTWIPNLPQKQQT